MAADWAFLDLVLPIGEGEHRSDIVHYWRNGHLSADGAHTLVLGAALLVDTRAKDRVATRAVVQIGQQHVIADRGEPARHILQLLADTVRVHQQEDGWRRSVALWMADEGLHLAALGRDVQRCFDHGRVSSHNHRPDSRRAC
jgi:hypothetical protein